MSIMFLIIATGIFSIGALIWTRNGKNTGEALFNVGVKLGLAAMGIWGWYQVFRLAPLK
jgi:hypothetical protein